MKAIAVSVLIIVWSTALVAQERQGPLEFGIKGGIALPSFFWTGDASWNPATMFAFQGEAFAFACLNLNEGFGVQAEFGYHGKGCSVDASDGYAHWYMDYVELPLWAKWRTGDADFSVYGGVGGYAAYFLGGRYEISTGDPSFDGSGKLSTGDAEGTNVVRPLDLGLLLAAGVEAGRMIYEFRFSIGVVPSIEFTPPPSFGGSRGSLNSGIDILVGYRL
jgi:hypothetical protein